MRSNAKTIQKGTNDFQFTCMRLGIDPKLHGLGDDYLALRAKRKATNAKPKWPKRARGHKSRVSVQ